MKKINKTIYALLGILGMASRTGYDIKKLTDRSIGFFWNENFGHVYPMLKKMKNDGLVKMRVEETGGGRPRRNIYSITSKGKRAFLSWLKTPVTDQPIRNELLLRTFFGRQMSTTELTALIDEEKRKNEELLSQYDIIENKLSRHNSADMPFWLMTLSYGKSFSRMVIQWCDETLTTLRDLEQEIGNEKHSD